MEISSNLSEVMYPVSEMTISRVCDLNTVLSLQAVFLFFGFFFFGDISYLLSSVA